MTTCGLMNSPSLVKKHILLDTPDYDVEVPCMVQWRTLRLSSPTSLNWRLVENDVILETYNEAIKLAFQSAFILPFWMVNTPRSCFLRSIHAVLRRSPGRKWDAKQRDEELGTGRWPELLPHDGGSDDGMDAHE